MAVSVLGTRTGTTGDPVTQVDGATVEPEKSEPFGLCVTVVANDGDSVGTKVWALGDFVIGAFVGLFVGVRVGIFVGAWVGEKVGEEVGSTCLVSIATIT